MSKYYKLLNPDGTWVTRVKWLSDNSRIFTDIPSPNQSEYTLKSSEILMPYTGIFAVEAYDKQNKKCLVCLDNIVCCEVIRQTNEGSK